MHPQVPYLHPALIQRHINNSEPAKYIWHLLKCCYIQECNSKVYVGTGWEISPFEVNERALANYRSGTRSQIKVYLIIITIDMKRLQTGWWTSKRVHIPTAVFPIISVRASLFPLSQRAFALHRGSTTGVKNKDFQQNVWEMCKTDSDFYSVISYHTQLKFCLCCFCCCRFHPLSLFKTTWTRSVRQPVFANISNMTNTDKCTAKLRHLVVE